MARFWSLVVAHANSHYNIHTEELTDETTAKFPELQIGKLVVKVDTCEFVGKVPEVLLNKVEKENEILKSYLLANPPPHPVRDIPDDLNQLIEKQRVVPRISIKRKGTPVAESSSPKKKKQKKKKKKKKKSKTGLNDEDSEETESDANLRRSPGTHPSHHNSPISTSEPLTSEPITTEPISTTTFTEPIQTSPLKTPPTTIPITTSTFTPDYSEQMNNPITSIPITLTIPIPISTATT